MIQLYRIDKIGHLYYLLLLNENSWRVVASSCFKDDIQIILDGRYIPRCSELGYKLVEYDNII